VPLDLTPGLNGVWMSETGVIHTVGVYGTRLSFAWDGTLLRDDSTYDRLDYHAVFGTPGRLFAVGGNLSSPAGPYHGIASTRARGADE
jgi:hypothetical protein